MNSNCIYLPINLNSELAASLLKLSRLQGRQVNALVTEILKEYLEENSTGKNIDYQKLQDNHELNLNLRIEIGKKIAFLRQANYLSQKDLGKLIGLERKIISNIELGYRRIDILELLGFSKTFRVDINYFFE